MSSLPFFEMCATPAKLSRKHPLHPMLARFLRRFESARSIVVFRSAVLTPQLETDQTRNGTNRLYRPLTRKSATSVVDCRHAIEQKKAQKQASEINQCGWEAREQGCGDEAQR
jgi:hypothetical protein